MVIDDLGIKFLIITVINRVKMLKGLLKIILICVLLSSCGYCKEVNLLDQEKKIDIALNIIKENGFKADIAVLQGENYTHKQVKIIFKDLTEIDFSYAKFYAITATDNYGDLFILINNNLHNSNSKCLACLILHELTHCKKNIPDSLDEEITAHQKETMLYIKLLEEDESLQFNSDRLTQRLIKLKRLYDSTLKAYISNNTAYVNYLKIKE